MPSISFDKSKGAKGVALVKGGDFDSEILFVNEEDKHKGKKPTPEVQYSRYQSDIKKIPSRERVKALDKINEALRKDLDADALVGESELVKGLFEKVKSDSERSTHIVLPDDSHFELIPSSDPKKREIFYIAGASGSGKSYIAKGLAEYYKKLFPDREVYLVSKLDKDPTLDKAKPKRIVAQTLVDDYPSIDEFKDCMVIFDDIDCFEGPILKAIHQLIDDIAITGRHTNTSMLFCTHYITNYKSTRLILNESSHFVVYPQSTSYHALGYLLKTHIGMSPEEVKGLRRLGRWVCIAKNYPQLMIAEHSAKLLHQ